MEIDEKYIKKIDQLVRGKLSDDEIQSFYEELQTNPSLLHQVKEFKENYKFLKKFFKKTRSPHSLKEGLFEKIEKYELKKYRPDSKSDKTGKQGADIFYSLAEIALGLGIAKKTKEYFEKAADLGHPEAPQKLREILRIDRETESTEETSKPSIRVLLNGKPIEEPEITYFSPESNVLAKIDIGEPGEYVILLKEDMASLSIKEDLWSPVAKDAEVKSTAATPETSFWVKPTYTVKSNKETFKVQVFSAYIFSDGTRESVSLRIMLIGENSEK